MTASNLIIAAAIAAAAALSFGNAGATAATESETAKAVSNLHCITSGIDKAGNPIRTCL